MATTNNKFLVKNGLAVGSSIDVINTSGEWVGATGALHGATGPQGASGVQGIDGASGYVGSDGATGIQGASGSTGLTGATGTAAPYVKKTANYTAVNGDYLIADTSGGAFTITLPASPSTGHSVTIADGDSFYTNNLTIARNGSTIEGNTLDLVVDVPALIVTLLYDGTTWEVYSSVGAQGATGPTGATGITGASGIGTQGASGVNGTTGAQGASGVQGNDGATGVSGINGSTGPTGSTGPGGVWTYVNGATTAQTGGQYVVDTSGGSFTITLPSSPTVGYNVAFADAANWATNNLTLGRNGTIIEGDAADLIVDVSEIEIKLIYDGSQWELFSSIGAAGATGVQGASGSTGLTGSTGPGGATGVQAPTALSVLNRSGTTITVTATNGNLSVLNRAGSTISVPVA